MCLPVFYYGKETGGAKMANGRVRVTKEFVWDCAHMLAEHEGSCKNLHGHTYRMEVTVERNDEEPQVLAGGPASGMVVDFSELSSIVKHVIVAPIDHSFVYWTNTPSMAEIALRALLEEHDMKIYPFPYRPTAENMCKWFWEEIQDNLPWTLKLVRIRIWETPTSYAEVNL